MQIFLKQLTTYIFNKYLLGVYHVSSAVLGATGTVMNKRDTYLWLKEPTFWLGR